jgi:type VII secretion protein EccB
MASKKELIQAQSYSRRRLLTVFTSGIPGGKELEPGKPLRAVVAGTALAVLLVVGSLIFGLISPGLPSGWDSNKLLIAKDSGARYVAIKGTLYPVLNTASAQLVIPSADFKVLTVDEAKIADAPRGETIGITGAPDSLPAATDLLPSGWASCTAPDNTITTSLSAGAPSVDVSDGAIVVTADGTDFVIADGVRYAVKGAESASVLRAIGLDTSKPLAVSARWINLFTAGSDLEAVVVPGSGSALPQPLDVDGRSLTVGTVVHFQDTPDDKRYVLTASGELAALSPFSYPLYLLGTGAQLGGEVEVTSAQLGSIPTASKAAQPADWPQDAVKPAAIDGRACAALGSADDGSEHVFLGTPRGSSSDEKMFVTPGHGALARAVNTGETNSGIVYLITDSGTAFPIPDASDDVLARLGFSPDNVVDVPQSWIALFAEGPSLTVDAASSSPTASPSAGGATDSSK